MANTINRLSARAVETLRLPGLHADGGGLYLRVDASGAKRWAFVFRRGRKRFELGLGPAQSVSLAVARQLAQDARAHVAAGRNPIDERRRQKASLGLHTFGALADQVITDLAPGWSSAVHARQWVRTLEVDAASLRPIPVASVTTDDVLAVLKPIWATKPETARRLRERIERILDAAKARGLRAGDNPARWRGHMSLLLARRRKLSRGHHAALPFDRMPGFIADLRGAPSVSAQLLEFTILTVSRTSEARLARIEEFNLDRGVWIVPAERMKRKSPHRVPLTARAIEIVRERIAALAKGKMGHNGGPPLEGYLFEGPKPDKPLSNMAMAALLPHMDYGKITVHGFRSSFKDWASDTTMFPREFSEAALSHAVGDEVERAYRRGDALDIRRQLMEAWGKHCEPGARIVVQMVA